MADEDYWARVDAALAEYHRLCEAGTPPDRSALLERYHDIADRLAEALDDHEWMSRMQAPRRCGNYLLSGEIGRGGMGVVFAATRVADGRKVAVKIPLSQFVNSQQHVARFLTEARCLTMVDDPHVVQILEVGGNPTAPYFVMELVGGGSLQQWIDARPPGELTAEELDGLLGVVADAARGLAAVHAAGILHRDVKSANVLLDLGGPPAPARGGLQGAHGRLADFGLARILRSPPLTQPGDAVGTRGFVAPEQARGAGIDQRADLYSLGAVIYHALTGELPFEAGVPESALRGTRPGEQPTRDRLAAVALRLLHADRDRRYVTATNVLDALLEEAATPMTLSGEILWPTGGTRGLPRPIPVRLRLSGVPTGHRVWLAVERHGLIWPKEPDVPPQARVWEGDIYAHEGGPRDVQFSLSLWLVPQSGHEAIRDWFGWAGRFDWPGLPELPGATRLCKVEGLTVA